MAAKDWFFIEVPVTFDLTIDGRTMSLQRHCYLLHGPRGCSQLINLSPLVQTQMLIAVHPGPSWKGGSSPDKS